MLLLAIISLILFVAYATLIFYYFKSWNAIPIFEPEEKEPFCFSTKITVIVPARNEEKNIKNLLDHLALQTYPKHLYEVIVVDDHSTDETWNLINHYNSEGMNLKCINLSDFDKENSGNAYKKFAIETAINQSSGDWIVTTDADCEPPADWLFTISSFQKHSNAKLIAAPVKINAGLNFLSIFQTLDFITLQGITGASVFKKIHSMCNGANLAYEKKAFHEVDGFKNIDNIPSGDDMFLMHKIYKKYPSQVFFLKNKNAMVATQPVDTWNGFINQRVRWASKADKYEDKRIFWVLLLVYLFNFLFLVLFIACFWNKYFLLLILGLLILKVLIEYPFVKSSAMFFDQKKLMLFFPSMQPLHILYTIVIGLVGKFGSYQWKGREINQ